MRRAAAVAYVVATAIIAGWAFHDPNRGGFDPWEAAAFALTLPASIPGLVPLYIVGAVVLNLSDTQQGTDWPVAIVYALMFAAFAGANLLLVRAARGGPTVSGQRTPS